LGLYANASHSQYDVGLYILFGHNNMNGHTASWRHVAVLVTDDYDDDDG